MKFSIRFSAILLALLSLLPAAVYAADSTLLSPAIAVLSKDASVKVTGVGGGNALFTAQDFDLTLGTNVDKITILTLPDPAEGTLCLGSDPVTVNQTVKRRHLGSLVFRPADGNGAKATFYFTADGTYSTACDVAVITEMNAAPTFKEESISTSALGGISKGISLSATDPDGDKLTYFITEYPKKGDVTVSADGTCIYTPEEKKRGRDSFTVHVRDEYGNWSDAFEVSVKIKKNKTGVEYSDLAGSSAYTDAVNLTAAGVMSGSDGKFEPKKHVSREEFITMLMKTVGLTEIPNVAPVGFADDSAISDSARNYCRAAKKLGLVNGASVDGKLYFNPTSEITHAEAAVILSNLIGIDKSVGDGAVSVFAADSAVPAWAKNAVGAMHAIGVMKITDGGASALSALTRADVAKILSAVMEMVVK